ncbi:hypothetical protein TrVE_jg5209 [Triparma verrucosa]|uniref:Protein YIPF n=2 Tax=Triparma TaxID=722752 RepID=A0A9W7EP10_9STRA|nr:hypothetical protein TrVE_jg5209 [Triparma verrucosa]GMH87709.1 hypothetical protein TrST_g3098 [Triparma strigata]
MDDEDDLLLLNDTGENSSSLPPPVSFSEPSPMSTPAAAPLNNGLKAPPASLCWCFDLRSYQPYFDINTSDIKHRVLSSLHVWKRSATTQDVDYFLSDVLGDNPDAYGPFWITMTLVFVVSVTSNINQWVHSTEDDFESDIDSLLNAMWIIYTFSFGIPLISYFALRCLGAIQGINFMILFSLYGYSLTMYIPAALLCVVPSQAVHWLSLLVASLFSGALIFRNLVGRVMQSEETKSRAILGWFAGCQIIMFLCLKLVFYA